MANVIQKATTLIIGAGGSKDYDFPLGCELREHIAKLDIGGHLDNHFAYHLKNQDIPLDDAGELLRLVNSIDSIDEILERYPHLERAGKCAIAFDLIQRETPNKIFNPGQNAGNSWYHYLFKLLASPNIQSLPDKKLNIVTLNYDRSLDYFLQRKVMITYPCTETQADGLLNELRIVHVHGSLGKLSEVPYEAFEAKDIPIPRITAAIKNIQTVHEARQNSQEFREAKEIIANSDQVVFLGFSYHPLTLKRLGFPFPCDSRDSIENNPFMRPKSDTRILGTAYGLSDAEIIQLTPKLSEKPTQGYSAAQVALYPKKILAFLKETGVLFE